MATPMAPRLVPSSCGGTAATTPKSRVNSYPTDGELEGCGVARV
ncbi:MAG: hypothetical protein ACLPLP_11325 [Mycobacterium sp.]